MNGPGKLPAGSKYTRIRYNDELARVSWREFESIMARWYAARGYAVTHRGTGRQDARHETDGGVDLILHGHGEKVLVQCKHHKVLQVPYNPVAELCGLIEPEGADRAIVITSGEFTRGAVNKAAKMTKVQLIDGAALRTMLGPDITALRDPKTQAMTPATMADVPPKAVVPSEPRPRLPAAGSAPIAAVAAHDPAPAVSPTEIHVAAPGTPRIAPVVARRDPSRLSRLIAVACVVVGVVALGVLGVRLRDAAKPEVALPAPVDAAVPAEPAKAAVAMAPTKKPAMPDRAVTRRHATGKRVPAKPSAIAPEAPTVAAGEPVIYKSSNMSDAEFADWKRRKAQRERSPTDSVRTDSPAPSPAVPAKTMQVILRTNRE